jgi:hypothetical protein
MAKFLNRFELTDELHRIIEGAKEYLILISPYIKLTDSIKRSLSKHKSDSKFELIVIYGKNEVDKSRSLNDFDMDFFKSFSNVKIAYHKRLHAKMYVNEFNCLLTSMNLHEYSMKENIEFGILTHPKLIDRVRGSLDRDTTDFAEYIIEKSTIEFEKKVKKEKSFFGLFTKYGDSEIKIEKSRYGYCIRTGIQIPFNPSQPYSGDAFHSWNQYKNPDYKEKYCHQCGEDYSTSMRMPVCNNCYNNIH